MADNKYSQEIAEMEISDSIAEVGMMADEDWAEYGEWLKSTEPTPCSMSDAELENLRTAGTPEEMYNFLFG